VCGGFSFCSFVIRRLLENPRAGMGIDISPMPAASWPNACATFAPAGKRTALESRTRLRRPPLICRRRGDEAHFKPGFWIFN